jgi:HEAT repeat protein
LGIIAKKLAAASPDRSQSLLAYLRQRLQRETSNPGRARVALEALGNGASEKDLDLISSFLADTDEATRSCAAFSLRGIQDPSVDERLIKLLTDDASPKVRSSAAEALGLRWSASVRGVLIQAVRHDQSADVRRQALLALSRRQTDDVEIAGCLTAVAENDSNEGLRSLARQLLKPGSNAENP